MLNATACADRHNHVAADSEQEHLCRKKGLEVPQGGHVDAKSSEEQQSWDLVLGCKLRGSC